MKSNLIEQLANAQHAASPVVPANALATARDWIDVPKSDHCVQFYEADSFLVDSVSEFIGAGLGAGEGAIVIATAPHREAIELRLASHGIDLAAVTRRKQFVALDAARTLSLFMVEGCPDPNLFEKTFATYITETGQSRRGLRAFGEMVAILWANGNKSGAIRLEELWNKLGEKHSFALLCAYPMRGFAGAENGEGFQHVCHTHKRVIPAESVSRLPLGSDDRLRSVALLQQKASSLEIEIAQRRRIEHELREIKHELEVQLEDMRQLHDISSRLTTALDLRSMLDQVLDGALSVHNTDMGILSIYDPALNALKTGVSRGFSEEFLNQVKVIPSGVGACGYCFKERRRVAVFDVDEDPVFAPYREAAKIGRFRSVHSTPLITRLGKLIGVLSVHFTERRRPTEREIQLMDLYARQAADLIENARLREEAQREIAERKRAEARLQTSAQSLDIARQELARANEELETRVQERTASLCQAVEQMEEFSYTVSHDLRAPLRAMTVYSQSLLEDFGQSFPHEARRFLERIHDNANRMDRMIRDVLDYSRLSRSEFPQQNVSLDKLVREIVSQYPGMQSDRAQITVEPLADVRGHEPSLVQAISNLLANAVKFVPSGVVPTVRVWTDVLENEVRLNIQDNGIGIPLDQRARLFQMFERLHNNSPYEGTGVGLAIVRKAAERMGGKVGVVSDGKCGSCFWIALPKAS